MAKRSVLILTLIFVATLPAFAQRRAPAKPPERPKNQPVRSSEIGQFAVVIDVSLSPLRMKPGLYSPVVHRVQRGRRVQIQGVEEADGLRFYKVAVPPSNFGFIQAEAVFAPFRAGDEERFARLVTAATGFDQLEMASEFFKMFPTSKFKPGMLLLFGDAIEEAAVKLSRDANSRLRRGEMAASGAPVYSYYLNFNMLDRYRKLGIAFLFNPTTRLYHYEGSSWKEIISRFPDSAEVEQARDRIAALNKKTAAK
jgi:hypothetical protein